MTFVCTPIKAEVTGRESVHPIYSVVRHRPHDLLQNCSEVFGQRRKAED
jgi:hypothetical protein